MAPNSRRSPISSPCSRWARPLLRTARSMHDRRVRRIRRSLGLVAVVALSSSPSRADEPVWTFPLEAFASRWAAPTLALNGDDASRRIVGLSVPSAATLFGVGAGVGLLFHDTVNEGSSLVFGGTQNLLHGRFAWSASSSPVRERADGLGVTMTRDPENLFELSAPALTGGFFLAYGHVMARANVDWGWAYLWTKGTAVQSSGATFGGSADSGSFFIHASLAACLLARSFDVKKALFREGEDLCLTLTPHIFEWGWLSGWSAGIRVDL
jgi:hypothetical protein